MQIFKSSRNFGSKSEPPIKVNFHNLIRAVGIDKLRSNLFLTGFAFLLLAFPTFGHEIFANQIFANQASAQQTSASTKNLVEPGGSSNEVLDQPSDNDILEAVESELQRDLAISSDSIDVQVNLGVVTLSGEAFTLISKREAIRAIGSLKNVRAVVDKIKVLPTSQSSEKIQSNVNAALKDDPLANSETVLAEVDDQGHVTLSGKTDSYYRKLLIETTVASIYGVTKITNDLKVEKDKERTAEEIKPEILRRFAISPFLAEGLIDVKVENGKVFLSGTVGSLNEKKLSELLSQVDGVDEVDATKLAVDSSKRDERRREKFSTVRTDVQIEKAAQDALLYDSRIRSAKIDLAVHYGAVTLTGTVKSLAAKRAAEDDVKNTIGVRRVVNRLKVRTSDWPGDKEMTDRAKAAFARDSHLSKYELRPSSHFGRLYVYGNVNTNFEKNRIENVLANVPGVRSVMNRVKLDSPWEDKDDEEIMEDVKRRLQWSPLLDTDSIKIRVDDGLVTLEGSVDTLQEKQSAARHARQAGAKRVKNNLKVRNRKEI